jgi:hypothetical protein
LKIQIRRFSVHQNAKVFAVMMAIASLVFVIPFFLFARAVGPKPAAFPSGVFILVLPLMYLVVGYVSVAIGCWVYNLLAKLTGGIEFESANVEA